MSIKYIKEIDKPDAIDILIPAAGLGRRMKAYGPKPLIKIKNNTTIIDNQLSLLKKYIHCDKTILVCGFEADLVMNNTPDYLIKIENEHYETTNVARSIGMGLRACTKDVMIIYGDVVFNSNTLKGLSLNHSCIISSNNIMDENEVGCTVNAKGYVENFMYDLESKWGQIVLLKGKELRMARKYCWDSNNYNKFGFEILNKIISQGGKILSHNPSGSRILDVDTSKDVERAKTII